MFTLSVPPRRSSALTLLHLAICSPPRQPLSHHLRVGFLRKREVRACGVRQLVDPISSISLCDQPPAERFAIHCLCFRRHHRILLPDSGSACHILFRVCSQMGDSELGWNDFSLPGCGECFDNEDGSSRQDELRRCRTGEEEHLVREQIGRHTSELPSLKRNTYAVF